MEVNLKMFFMLHGADVVVHLSRIQKEILRMNREQNIRNSDRLGHVVHTDDVIIVVQVHDRVQHLQLLIQSLSRVGLDPFLQR